MNAALLRVLVAGVLALAATGGSPAAQSFYVSPSGSDANPGTFEAPWRTVQRAADSATPGSTVTIRAGTYRERVTVRVSGSTAAGPITFRTPGTERAVLDGTGLAAPVGASALLWIANQHDLVFDGLEIANYQTAVTDSVVAGVYVDGTGSNITLRRLLVHDIRHNGTAPNGTDAHAIAFYGRSATSAMTGIVIDACEVRNCVLGSSEAVVVNGNVDGFRVTRNVIHDCNNIGLLAVGWEGTAPVDDQARNGVVADNLVFNITSYGNPAYGTDRSAGGIYCDGCRDSLFERNIVHHTDLGIEIGNEHGGRTTSGVIVRDNVSYLNNVCGLAFGGYDTTRGIVQDCTFVGNTFYHNDTTDSGTGEISIQKGHDNTLTQNVIAPTAQAIAYTNYFTPAHSYANTTSYNDIYAPNGVPALFTWQNRDYVGLAAYRAATGQEQHSIASDPRFVANGATPPDLHRQSGSPAIDAGDPAFLAAPKETDADGRARVLGGRVDIGAYEAPPCPGAPPSDRVRLSLQTTGAGASDLDWTAAADATGYDVPRGDLGALRATRGDFAEATRRCLASNTPRTTREDREYPPPGAGFWYVVRGRNCLGPGTYDDGPPGQAGSRDAEIDASTSGCP